MSRGTRLALLLCTPLLAGLGGVFVGSVSVPPGDLLAALVGGGTPLARTIVELRVPRVLLAALVGGGLALSGTTFQALLRNPLAEPYILGISGGAATGAVIVLAFGITALGSFTLPLAAFAGALLAIVLVFRVANVADHRLDVRVLLLAGVVVGAFFSAAIALILSLSEADTVRSAMLWMLGSVAGASWREVAVAAAYTLPASAVLIALARPLNLLSVGEESAAYLGADVEGVKRTAYVVASLVTAAGVAVAGVIGFVGLVIPHTLRLLVGSDHRTLLPLSFAVGAAFLVVADLGARSLFGATEIPIGVVTAFVGVPVFLVLLRRSLA
ncbi:iron ABC transporter permease [Gaopeijia maritima]|uniref:FecCD family ABC transporter permease n=1 Tax=Gaopeijia maritima TaxID=3119007 RepID=UPI003247E4A8